MSRPLPLLHPLHEDAAEYTAFLLELRHAADLLDEGGVVAERMALTITDSLADRLLYQHAQRCLPLPTAAWGFLLTPSPPSGARGSSATSASESSSPSPT